MSANITKVNRQDAELIEVLIAISKVSAKLAKQLAMLAVHNKEKEAYQDERNERCCQRITIYCCRY